MKITFTLPLLRIVPFVWMLGIQAWAAPAAAGPFDSDSELPFHLPPFDRISEDDYRPALLAGMRIQREEVAAIAANPQAPDFDNTIVALERSGRLLNRVLMVFTNLSQSNTNPQHQAIDAEVSPLLAAHQDAIFLNAALFARVQALYQRRAALGLDGESLRLLERYHQLFVRAGALLASADQERLRDWDAQLAALNTRYEQTLLKADNDGAVIVDRPEELSGLSAEQIDAAAAAAQQRHLDGHWLLTLENTTVQPALSQLRSRALRERLYRASIARGAGGADDTTAIIAQILDLRARRAELLGFPSHAAYVLADETAATPQAVNGMLSRLAGPAIANVRAEAAQLQQLIEDQARREGTHSFTLQAWDWAYYAGQLRKSRYDFDEAQVRPYFELEHVLHDGVFYAAEQLYGLSFRERNDLPKYQADVRVFEVFDRDGSALGLLVLDYFARSNKQGGAWMNEFISQSRLFGQRAVVVNVLNVAKPSAGQPVLLSFDEVNTMFHEFGHALHGLFSDVQYPLFAGTAVPQDFVEYPSQFNEMWSRDQQVVAHFARNYRNGAAMPPELLARVLAASRFTEGFDTVEYLAAAIVDQALHQLPAGRTPAAGELAGFEAATLRRAGLDFAPVGPRYHIPYFAHIFSTGYAAAYYAYLWSDVLAKDSEQWMISHGGLQRANGDFLRAKVLGRGFSRDPASLFKEFYGREPDVGPLLQFRGLAADPRPDCPDRLPR